jgi:hypothetical protein
MMLGMIFDTSPTLVWTCHKWGKTIYKMRIASFKLMKLKLPKIIIIKAGFFSPILLC